MKQSQEFLGDVVIRGPYSRLSTYDFVLADKCTGNFLRFAGRYSPALFPNAWPLF